MFVPTHHYKSLKQFGDKAFLGAPFKFQGWLDTGVADCNGQNVFEGDLVEVNGTPAGAVTFHDGAFWAGGMLIKNFTDGELEVVGHISEATS